MLGAALAVNRAVVATDATEAGMELERVEAEIGDMSGRLVVGECQWLVLLSDLDPMVEAVFTASDPVVAAERLLAAAAAEHFAIR